MTRPKMKIKDKKKGISVSISIEVLKKLKKKIPNISGYIEKLIVKDLEE